MPQDYDVVIVGAGPAGGQCARYIAEHSKFSVLVLDKTQEIGEPKKSTAGTFPETITRFNLPKKVIQEKTNKIVFEGPTQEAVIAEKGFVLEFGRLKKFLVEQAVHHGAELRIGAAVKKPLIENKKVVGVSYNDFEGEQEARARIIIDATGPPAVIATKLGLRKLNPANHWAGIEFEMEELDLNHQNMMLLKFDDRYAPGGYSWIFSTGNNHAKVGNCWNVSLFQKKGGKGSQASYLKKWIRTDKRLKSGEPMEMHAGNAYFSSPFTKKLSTDNFMAIGDVVCSVYPPFGEGIRPGMYSGEFAAQTAIDALKSNNTSAKKLAKYDQKWRASIGKNRKLCWLFTKLLYSLSNPRYDKLVKNLQQIDAKTVKRFVNYDFTLKDLRKLIPI